MLWLGLRGRVKIAALEERVDKLEEAFRSLDLEMTGHVDRLAGLAKRIQGRRGGRPPASNGKEQSDADAESELPTGEFSRHVL